MRRRFVSVLLALIVALSMPLSKMPYRVAAQGPGDGKWQDYPLVPFVPPASGVASEPQMQRVDATGAPANDDINGALLIPGLPYYQTISTTDATVAADDPYMTCTTGRNSNTVWFRLMLFSPGLVEANTFGSDYDTVLAVFTGLRGALQEVVCDDDTDQGQSEVYFEAVANQEYYFEVADYGSPGGGQLRFSVHSYAESVANERLAVNVAALGTVPGRFVIGTTGGDPGSLLDNDKRLLYGYPWTIGTTFATLRVVTAGGATDYRLGENAYPVVGPTANGSMVVAVWEVGNVRVEQRLYFALNPDTARWDTVAIEYQLTNISSASCQAGLRLLLDTMIGDNDGAPIFVPLYGRITQETELSGAMVPDFWTAWESPAFDPDSLKAKAWLRHGGVTPPNRLVIAHWDNALCPGTGPGLYQTNWDYQVNPSTAITCDSAVALYYYPTTLNPGQSRTVRTYYGLAGSGAGLDLGPDIVSFVAANQQQIIDTAEAAGHVSTVGDYFLDKQEADEARWAIDLGLNVLGLASAGINWARVGRGLGHVATPGYEAGLRASWRGWTEGSEAAKHWYKPVYDALHNNRELVLDEVSWAGLRYYAGDATKGPIKDWLINTFVPGLDTPVYHYWGLPAMELGGSYYTEIAREQDELLSRLAVQPLTSEQVDAYREDMLARQEANAQVVDQLQIHRDLLWSSYEEAVADEHNWWKIWGPLMAKWFVVGTATLLFDGPGFYVTSLGTAAFDLLYDTVRDTRSIAHDGKMLSQSASFLTGRTSLVYRQVSLNTVGALNVIRAGEMPQIAGGDVTVAAMKSLGHYRLWPDLWWAEESSQADLVITNSRSFATTYFTSASYDHSDFWSGTERLLPEGQALDLASGAQGRAVVRCKARDWGASPSSGGPVDFLVLGATETGLYPVADLQEIWNPIRVEQTTGVGALAPAGVTQAEAAEAPTYPYPLSSVVAVLPDSTDQQLTITILNPFRMAVRVVITQTISGGFSVLDAGGAQRVGDDLVWSADLEPSSGMEFSALLRLTGATGESAVLPGSVLAFEDPSTGSGDNYTAPARSISAAWPIDVSANVPELWKIDTVTSVPITLTNLSAHVATSGVFTGILETLDGSPLWSTSVSFDVAPGGRRSLSVAIPTPALMGYVVLRGEIRVGAEQREQLIQVIEIQGYRGFLPVAFRQY